MCGICGLIHLDPHHPVEEAILAALTRTMVHRGPDDEGLFLQGPVGLGHRRLSIIDLDTGRQPIHNEDQTIWIVYNGELYNSPALRRRLLAAGHRFYTKTDTEVIVHAYEEYGPACLSHLNGMFAFALWDQRQQRLLLARDRIGIKPLYYTELPGLFLFASELKAILAHPAVARRLDPIALNQYLAFEYVPTPRTIFAGIHKLAPGHLLTLTDGRADVTPYWDIHLNRSESAARKSTGDYSREILEVLKEAVRLELIADVPVGVLLSGGIDSSAVAAMMVQHAPGQAQSFAIAFEDPSFDEAPYARQVARHLGTHHHELTLTSARMLELVPRLGQYLDEPLGDSSFIPTFWLSHFTRQHVKVALGGDGGDELFAGYSTLQAHRLLDYYRRLTPAWLRHRLAPRLVESLPVSFDNLSFDFKARRFIAGQDLAPPLRHHLWLGSFTASQRQALLGPLATAAAGQVDGLALSHAQASEATDPLNQILYCDLKLYLEGDILAKVDRASMANSLEVRVPLLNQLLLEYAEQLPLDLKLHRLTTKYLLRRALKDLLPANILARGKKGFNMPVAKWLTGPLLPLTQDLLAAPRLKRAGLFNPNYVQSLLADHLARRRDHRKLLWTLLAFELWYDHWM